MTEPITAITSSPTPDQIEELALQNQVLAVQTQELAHQASILAATQAKDTVNLSAIAQARVRADEAHVEQTDAHTQATRRADAARAEQISADAQATQRADETRAEQRSADVQSVIHEYQVLANETADAEAADQARSQSNAAATP